MKQPTMKAYKVTVTFRCGTVQQVTVADYSAERAQRQCADKLWGDLIDGAKVGEAKLARSIEPRDCYYGHGLAW